MSVCLSVFMSVVCVFTVSNMNISATSGPTATKIILSIIEEGEGCIRFWSDRIGTLVSMAMDSSHTVIMGKILCAISR